MSLRLPARVASQPGMGTSALTGPRYTGKAGPIGPGAGVLMTEYLLNTALGTEPQDRMRRALDAGTRVDWIRAAERAISSKVSSCEWHLEDPEHEKLDAEYKGNGSVIVQQLLDLLTEPQKELPLAGADGVGRRMSRRQLYGITSRHMGLAGQGAWYLDLMDLNNNPHALLYIRPDRLTPVFNDRMVLKGWLLDKRPGDPGIPLDLDRLLLSQLQLPDSGVFAPGLVESSMAKAINNGLIDKHYTALLSSGGRISGILAPKEGAINDDGVYDQLVRDWRNVTEQPEAARRLQIVRAPVEFTSTVQSVGDMNIIDLMYHNRDALLALWGVPLSQLGGSAAAGFGGDVRNYEEAALWQIAVHDRLVEIGETIQHGIVDRFEEALGFLPTFVWDEPEFDDDTPNFEKLTKASGTPLRNKERRAIIGLEPFGDPALDNAIWMPVQVVAMSMAPDEETGIIPKDPMGVRMVDNPLPVPEAPGQNATQTPAVAAAPSSPNAGTRPAARGNPAGALAKAAALSAAETGLRILPIGARRLRDRLDETITPKLTAAVATALDTQGDDIAARVEAHWDAIVRHGGRDDSMWWTDEELMARALKPAISGVAEAVADHIKDAFQA